MTGPRALGERRPRAPASDGPLHDVTRAYPGPVPDHHAEILRAIAHGPAPSTSSSAQQKVAYVLRGHVLQRIARALSEARRPALLVKGAALALTIYSPPWTREMDDIDLLVRAGDRDVVAAALAGAGCSPLPGAPGRARSQRAFAETLFDARCGALHVLVEVHTSLDKLVSRPVDHDGIFARAAPAPDLPGLLVPSPEDHALLIALHEAGHEFRHVAGFLDLHLLLERGLSLAVLAERARAFRLETVVFVALATLEALGSRAVPPGLTARFRPSEARLRALRRYYDVGCYPVAKGPSRLGLPWVVRQLPLRDDLGAFCSGVLRYVSLRAVERAFKA